MFSELLFNQKVMRQMAKEEQRQPEGSSASVGNNGATKKCDRESTAVLLSTEDDSMHDPGPAARDTMPLRALFAEHVEKVAKIPILLHNMPMYYSIVASALDSALEQAEIAIRSRALSAQALSQSKS